jgi:hypothetical protein
LHDAIHNRRFANADQRILVARHPSKNPFFYDVLLHWLEQNFPPLRSFFELRSIPFRIPHGSRYALHVPWLQDPVQKWSPTVYRQANRLATECDDQGIPIINRVDRLVNAVKSTGARLIGSAGIRTPRMVLIENVEEFRETHGGLELPLLVREDWGHGGLVCRADTPSDVQKLPLQRFIRPVAIEFIDVQNRQDGLYRKFRYVAAGNIGIAQSIHVCKGWKAKGTEAEYSDALRDEELAYTSCPDPNHERLQVAREALGLDFIAFDYSYDLAGRLVVWEANAYPHIHFSGGRRIYRRAATIRTLAAMTSLYLMRAALAVPAEIKELLEESAQQVPSRADVGLQV